MDLATPLAFAHSHPCRRTLGVWLVAAWELFRSAPLPIAAVSLFPLVVEAALHAVPDAGIASSKVVTPLASAWVLALLDSQARTGRFAAARAGRLWLARFPQLLLVSLLLVGVFVFQLLVAAAIGGGAQALHLARGEFGGLALSRSQLAIVLAAGVVPGSLLMFVGPRVLLDGIGVGAALRESVRRVGDYWRPVALLALLSAALVASLPWMPLLLLAYVPFATCVGYGAYRDVFPPMASGRS